MEEKKNTLLEKLKENKKQVGIVVVLVLVLLLGVGGFGIYTMNSKENASNKTAQTEDEKPLKKTKKTTAELKDKNTEQKEDTEEQKNTEKKEQTEQEGKKEEKKATEENKTVAQNSKPGETKPTVSKPSTSKPSTSTSKPVSPQQPKPQKPVEPQKPVAPQKPSHTHNFQPVYTQKWVVDQPAWTETVETPVYEMVEQTICNTCGAIISGVAGQHLDETMHAGYRSDWVQVQTGTKTETINHPEQGHYENVLSHSQCSCGAVK